MSSSGDLSNPALIAKTSYSEVWKIGDYAHKKSRKFPRNLREISFLKAIDHPSIIKLVNVIEEDNEITIITPLMEKITPTFDTESLYFQCLEILKVLEKMKIVHLDFRIENLVSQNGKVILIDFGNAHLMGTCNIITSDRFPPKYVRAPEFNKQQALQIDYRADMWSLGVIIYERIHKYYPQHFSNLRKIEGKMGEDIIRILTTNPRPLASELLEKEVSLGKINFPSRKSFDIEGQTLYFDQMNNNYIEIKNNYDHILRLIDSVSSINNTVPLFSSWNELKNEEMKMFNQNDQQLFSINQEN